MSKLVLEADARHALEGQRRACLRGGGDVGHLGCGHQALAHGVHLRACVRAVRACSACVRAGDPRQRRRGGQVAVRHVAGAGSLPARVTGSGRRRRARRICGATHLISA
jgi:hypothetical protein